MSKRDDYNGYMRVYMNARYRRRIASAVESLGGKCARCGSTNDLEFDHVDPTTKLFELGKKPWVSEARWCAELAKCQLLCIPCHQIKSATESGKTLAKGAHGTVSAYRFCGPPKCEECKAAKREMQRRWRLKRSVDSIDGSLA